MFLIVLRLNAVVDSFLNVVDIVIYYGEFRRYVKSGYLWASIGRPLCGHIDADVATETAVGNYSTRCSGCVDIYFINSAPR